MSKLKPIRPTPAQQLSRQRQLYWHRRVARVAGWLAPRTTLRLLANQLSKSDAGRPAVPLAFLDACGFDYPKVSVDLAAMETQVHDWCLIEHENRAQVVNTIDCFVLGGSWRRIMRPQAQRKVEDEARQLYTAQLRFRQTEAYLALLAEVEAGRTVRRQGKTIATVVQLDSYFERFCQLFESIQQHGLLAADGVAEKKLRTNSDRPLGVAMDADGALYRLQGGNHRWAIARVLGIEHAEVELRLVHRSFAAQYL